MNWTSFLVSTSVTITLFFLNVLISIRINENTEIRKILSPVFSDWNKLIRLLKEADKHIDGKKSDQRYLVTDPIAYEDDEYDVLVEQEFFDPVEQSTFKDEIVNGAQTVDKIQDAFLNLRPYISSKKIKKLSIGICSMSTDIDSLYSLYMKIDTSLEEIPNTPVHHTREIGEADDIVLKLMKVFV